MGFLWINLQNQSIKKATYTSVIEWASTWAAEGQHTEGS